MEYREAIEEAFQYLEVKYSPKWTSGKGRKEKLIEAFSQLDIPKATYLGYSGGDGVMHSFNRAIPNHNKPKGMLWETWLLSNIGKFYCPVCKTVQDLELKVSTKSKYTCKPCDVKLVTNRRDRNRELVLKYLLSSNGCVDCGETDPVVLEFDHRDPTTKEFNIGESYGKSAETIMLELHKCDIVCANCHRKRTAKVYDFYRFKNS